jgi:GNAT superfamily N-acetyltransferase
MSIPLFFVYNPKPNNAFLSSRELVAMPCRPGGPREREIRPYVADSDCREDIARHQVGAMRWDDATAKVTMIYVPPALRRTGIATALWRAADRVPLLHGRTLTPSPHRTVLGELLCTRRLGIDAPLQSLVLPMTPAAKTAGAALRQLVPDDRDDFVRDISKRYDLPADRVDALCEPTFEAAARRLEVGRP